MKKLFLYTITSFMLIQTLTGCGRGEKQSIQQIDNIIEHEVPNQMILNVEYIDQREKYPTGCESVSTVMALRYLGIDITVNEFIDQYLDIGQPPHMKNEIYQGCDPWEQFPGNPYTSRGWGCFAPVIMKTLKKLPQSEHYTIKDLYNVPIEELCQQYIAKGIPVVFWASIDMKELQVTTSWKVIDSQKTVEWKSPMHCLLMTGYDQNYYYFNDPMRGKNIAYEKKSVEMAYYGMGSQAIVIMESE